MHAGALARAHLSGVPAIIARSAGSRRSIAWHRIRPRATTVPEGFGCGTGRDGAIERGDPFIAGGIFLVEARRRRREEEAAAACFSRPFDASQFPWLSQGSLGSAVERKNKKQQHGDQH